MLDIEKWGEFGVLAVVIGALFFFMSAGFKIFMTYIDKQNNSHKSWIQSMHAKHESERKDWYFEEERRSLRMESALKQLADSVHKANED